MLGAYYLGQSYLGQSGGFTPAVIIIDTFRPQAPGIVRPSLFVNKEGVSVEGEIADARVDTANVHSEKPRVDIVQVAPNIARIDL